MAPLNIQKMILFLLQKGTKDFHLILGGIFVATMKSAASVRKISIGCLECGYITNKHVFFYSC